MLVASAAVASGYAPLPLALSGTEIAHCVLPFALWQVDVLLLRWMVRAICAHRNEAPARARVTSQQSLSAAIYSKRAARHCVCTCADAPRRLD